MDANNYVAQRSDGQWVAVVNGVLQAVTPTQQQAEQAFNIATGQTGTPSTTPRPAPAFGGLPPMTLGGGAGFLDPAIEAANAAAQQQYLRDRLAQLDIPGLDLQRLMSMLGITGYYSMPTATQLTDDQALDAIWQKKPDLKAFYQKNGWKVGTPTEQRAAVRNWISSADPRWKGKTAQQVAAALGVGGAGMEAVAGGAAGGLPTFAREQWNEGNRQYWNKFLASLSGPRNYRQYEAMLPSIFGDVAGGPSWEQAATQFATSGQNTPTAGQIADWWRPPATNPPGLIGPPAPGGGPGLIGPPVPGGRPGLIGPPVREGGGPPPGDGGPLPWFDANGNPLGRPPGGPPPGYEPRPMPFERVGQDGREAIGGLPRPPGPWDIGRTGTIGPPVAIGAIGALGPPTPAVQRYLGPPPGTQGTPGYIGPPPARQPAPGASGVAYSFRQPTGITARDLARMTPTKRAMIESDWSYSGLDPADMWQMVNKAQPTGAAPSQVWWK